MLVPSDLAVFNNHLAYVRLINAGLVTESSVKNSQVIDLESGIGALGQSNLPGIVSAEGDSLQI